MSGNLKIYIYFLCAKVMLKSLFRSPQFVLLNVICNALKLRNLGTFSFLPPMVLSSVDLEEGGGGCTSQSGRTRQLSGASLLVLQSLPVLCVNDRVIQRAVGPAA